MASKQLPCGCELPEGQTGNGVGRQESHTSQGGHKPPIHITRHRKTKGNQRQAAATQEDLRPGPDPRAPALATASRERQLPESAVTLASQERTPWPRGEVGNPGSAQGEDQEDPRLRRSTETQTATTQDSAPPVPSRVCRARMEEMSAEWTDRWMDRWAGHKPRVRDLTPAPHSPLLAFGPLDSFH